MEEIKPVFQIPFFGHNLGVTEGIIAQWVIIVIALIISIMLTKNLKRIPDKKQTVLEMFVGAIRNIVKGIMGEEYMGFVPYVGSLALFLLVMNLTGMIGFGVPTEDFSVAFGMALTTFAVIQGYIIVKTGLGNFLAAFARPFAFLTPINIVERLTLPVSLSLRLFGNMTASGVIMALTYKALGSIPIFNKVAATSWIGQLLLPIPLHCYFDLFDGTIQMIIFTMLTMIQIKVTFEH